VPLGFVALPLVGLALLVTGVTLRRATTAFLRGAAQAPGIVVDHVPASVVDGWVLCPVVHYRLPDGSEQVFTAADGQMPPRHRVGHPVVVYYDPAQPGSARLATTTALPTMLIAVGTAVLVVSAVIGGITWWVFAAVRGS